MAIASMVASGVASGAQAQTNSSAAAPPVSTPASAPAVPTIQEIIVTGSRIARADYVSDTPIASIGATAIANAGAPTLETVLNQMPQITASAGSSSSFTARGGQANLDLRGLGDQRTLVLIDGRRLQPSNPDGSVDLNILPRALIDNVEVVTGGASSTYGSDAVTGVVNFKLRKRFTGFEIDDQNSITTHGDGTSVDVTGIAGTDFDGGKGNVFVAFDYTHRDAIAFPARSYLQNQALSTTYATGSALVNAANLPSQAAVNAVFAKYGYAAGSVSRTAQFGFNTNGTLFSGLKNFAETGSPLFTEQNGGLYSNTGIFNDAQIPLDKKSVFVRSTYDVSPAIKVFAEGLYTHYTTQTVGPPPNSSSVSNVLTVPVTNPFISPDLAALLASRPNPTAPFAIQQRFDALGPRTEDDSYDVFQITAGATGKLTANWTWNADATYGQTLYKAAEVGYPLISSVQQLLSAPDGGRSICSGGLDPFGLQPLSAACAADIEANAVSRTTLSQFVVEGNVQGPVFRLPAGTVRAAIGTDYRRNTYSYTPAPAIASGNLANFNPILPSSGSDDVKEIYGELLVPVLSDHPFFEAVNLDLGYRYANYRVSHGGSTYKMDADWKIGAGFSLRGGYSRAARAPSVGELYAADTQTAVTLGVNGAVGNGDPCDINGAYRKAGANNPAAVRALCLAEGIPPTLIDSFINTSSRAPTTTSGNTALKPEEANTYSIGGVYHPHSASKLFSSLSLSVDYYHIKLAGAIGSTSAQQIAASCFDADGSNPTYSAANFSCAQITRNPTSGLISNITTPLLNLGGYATSGIDVEADWTIGLDAFGLPARWGKIAFSGVGSYLKSFVIQTLPGAPKLDYAGTIGNRQIDYFADAHPRWKATGHTAYSIGRYEIGGTWRYIGGMANASNVGTAGTLPGVSAISYFDADAAIRIGRNSQLRIGVTNLTDKAPPVVYTSTIGQYSTDMTTYDIVGRTLFVSIKGRF